MSGHQYQGLRSHLSQNDLNRQAPHTHAFELQGVKAVLFEAWFVDLLILTIIPCLSNSELII